MDLKEAREVRARVENEALVPRADVIAAMDVAFAEVDRQAARRIMYGCETHGDWDAARESGCPECVRQLRAEVDRLEKENAEAYSDAAPIAWMRDDGEGSSLSTMTACCSDRIKSIWLKANPQQVERYTIPLYGLEGIRAALAEVDSRSLLPHVRQLRAEVDRLEESIGKIISWSEAYPVAVFPEPDLKRAAQLLEDGGMSLDSISAAAMRYVLAGVVKIAKGE